MRQEYALGEFLKSRYMRTFKLLNSTYIYKEVSKPKGFFFLTLSAQKRLMDFFALCTVGESGKFLFLEWPWTSNFFAVESRETCALKSGIQLKESEIPLTMESDWSPSSTDKESWSQYLRNPESKTVQDLTWGELL